MLGTVECSRPSTALGDHPLGGGKIGTSRIWKRAFARSLKSKKNLGTDQGTLAGSSALITGQAVALFDGPERRLRPKQR
jgi:hypothetical protein